MHVVLFRAEHMRELLRHNPTRYMTDALAEEYERKNEFSFTIFEGDKILACMGVYKYWEGRGEVWSVLDQNSREHFIKVHNVGKQLIKNSRMRRLEATVDSAFAAGHRWMRLLGFKKEGEMKKFYPDGADVTVYARIKEDE